MDVGWPEIAIIAVVILVLFGSKKLPEAARSLGRSMRIMKTEIKGLHDDDDAATTTTAPAQLPAAATVETTVVPAPVEPVSAGDQTPAP
jgi:sec-independent protein translocase protein TatA